MVKAGIAMAPEVEQRRGVRVSVAVGISITALLCLTTIPLPFTGDQALFSLGGQALGQGRDLYSDFWDLKQPGIFAFFRVADATIGSSEVAAHVLELLWQLALAVVLVRAFMGRLRHPLLVGVVPLLCVGLPAAVATPLEVTQVESLVGLPIFLAVWLVVRAAEDPSGRAHTVGLVVAGFCAFVVAAFKLLLLAIPLACWAVTAVMVGTHRRHSIRQRWHWMLPLGAGLLVPSAVFVVWAARANVLGEIWHTWFELPLGVAERAGRPTARLWDSATTFGALFAPVIVLAVIGVARAVPRRGDPIAQVALVWLFAGAVAFLLQLWWLYLLFVLAVPLGILATFGVDVLLSGLSSSRRNAAIAVLVACVLLSGFAAARFGRRVDRLRTNGFAIGAEHAEAFRIQEWSDRRAARSAAEFLERTAGPTEAVAVFGDPTILYLSARQNALATNGWAPEHFDRETWERAADELAATEPALVFVDDFSAPLIEERAARVHRILSSRYEQVRRASGGTWYARRASGTKPEGS